MGVGNWGMRSARFDTETWHVDATLVTFEDYRANALAELRGAVKLANPEISDEALKHVTFDKYQDAGWEIEGLDEIQETIREEFQFLDDRDGYSDDVSDDRYADLSEGLQGAVAVAVGDTRDFSELRKAMKQESCDTDKDAVVMGVGKLTQVVLRSWQHYYYIGIGPTNALEDNDSLFDNSNVDVETLLVRCMAALDPDSPKLAAYRTPLAPIELRPHEIAALGVAAGDGNINFLDAVVRRAMALAESLELKAALADNLDPQERAELEARCADFEAGFGVDPGEFSLLSDPIEDYLEFVERIGLTPGMAEREYEEELRRMKDVVLNFMAVNEEEAYQPNGAWTSGKADLSAYRHAAAVQVDAHTAALIKSGQDGALIQALVQNPSRVSLMRESDFDASLASAVEKACPIEMKLKPGMFTLHENDTTPEKSAVLVWRGHLNWGHFDLKKFEAASQKLLDISVAFELSELPQWMAHVTRDDLIRETLESLAVPPEVAKSFYADDGSLLVTGVLTEVGNGALRAVYVTNSRMPMDEYEPIVLNGLVKAAPAPVPEMGVSHG